MHIIHVILSPDEDYLFNGCLTPTSAKLFMINKNLILSSREKQVSIYQQIKENSEIFSAGQGH